MYAVIESGGKQHRVELGSEIQVDRLDAQAGDSVTLERVLLVADGEDAAIGQPVVDGATVSAQVVAQVRGDKLIVFKYKPKARTRVKQGFRAELTTLRITDIAFGGKSAAKDAAQAEKEAARQAKAAEQAEKAAAEKAAAEKAEADKELAAKLAEGAGSGKTKSAKPKGKAAATNDTADTADEAPAEVEEAAAPADAPEPAAADAPEPAAAEADDSDADKTDADDTKKDE